ncbi:hypothetical protein EMCRGX_G003944 [Ephydatia muelleri]
MTDPTQQCPDSWQMITSPRTSCGKKSNELCDSLKIPTSGVSYQTVCGRFRGYQIGTPDAFQMWNQNVKASIEIYYVDGVTVTYGSPGSRHHVYTYAAGINEWNKFLSTCPCTGAGAPPPLFVGYDYYCESGNVGPDWNHTEFYFSDVLWDRQQCGGNETMCCNPPDLPWFCKTFPTPISEDLEVRLCTDQGLDDENVLIESFELYIQVNNTSVASIETYAIIGITSSISFVVFFSLGVLVAICIGCMVKRKSKVTPGEKPPVYETVEPDQIQVAAIAVEANYSYDIATNKETVEQPYYIDLHV